MPKLSVLIGGDDRELQAALRRAESSMRKFSKNALDNALDLGKTALAASTAGAALTFHFVKGAQDSIDAQAKLSKQLNTTVASMATLERAADLDGVSLEKLQTTINKMNVTLGDAERGVGPAVDSLKQLHLTAEELAQLPVDQRIALINERIREYIPLSQQAAIASGIFGDKAAAAIVNVSPETIRQAAEETKLFGTALNEIDAKKVEIANDSISRFGLAFEGFWKQAAVQVSGVLKILGDDFTDLVRDAGGVEKVTAQMFENIVLGAARTADQLRGPISFLTRTIEEMWEGFNALPAWVQEIGVAGAILGGKKGALAVAGIALEAERTKVIAQWFAAMQSGHVSFSEWLTSGHDKAKERLKELGTYVEDVKPAGDVSILKSMFGSDDVDEEEFEKKARALLDRAKKVSDEAAQEALASQRGASEESPETVDKDDAINRRLEQLRDRFRSEDELSFQQRDKELEQIAEFEKLKRITEDEANRLREESEQAHWDRIGEIKQRAADSAIAIEKAKNAVLEQAQNNFMNNMSGLMNTQSRKVFEIGKASAIGQAGYKGALAVMDAWEAGMSTGGPWAPFIAAAYATAAGLNSLNLINNIRSQKFGGASTPVAPTQGSSNIAPPQASGGNGGGQQQQGPTSIFHLHGEFFSRDAVRRLGEMANEDRRDGGRWVFA